MIPQGGTDFGMRDRMNGTKRLEKGRLGLKEMNVGIPERIISVENQVEAAPASLRNHRWERNRQPARAQLHGSFS
jgi:hypothetical protein